MIVRCAQRAQTSAKADAVSRRRPLASQRMSYHAVSANVNPLIATLQPQSNGPSL